MSLPLAEKVRLLREYADAFAEARAMYERANDGRPMAAALKCTERAEEMNALARKLFRQIIDRF